MLAKICHADSENACTAGMFWWSWHCYNIVNSLMELLLIQMKEPVKFMESLVQVPLVGLL